MLTLGGCLAALVRDLARRTEAVEVLKLPPQRHNKRSYRLLRVNSARLVDLPKFASCGPPSLRRRSPPLAASAPVLLFALFAAGQ